MLNFERNLHYLGANLDNIFLEIIFGEYLACKGNYTSERFYIRYNNVILFCGLFSIINKTNISWHVKIKDDNLSFSYVDEEGNVTQLTTMLWRSRDINIKTDYVSLYYGLSQKIQQKIYRLFKQENVQFHPLSCKSTKTKLDISLFFLSLPIYCIIFSIGFYRNIIIQNSIVT